MHTYIAARNTIFHYNSDFSGDILVHVDGYEEPYQIPAQALLEFVFETFVKNTLVGRIEEMSLGEAIDILAGK